MDLLKIEHILFYLALAGYLVSVVLFVLLFVKKAKNGASLERKC